LNQIPCTIPSTAWSSAASWYGVVELVGPTRVVEEVRGGERHVDIATLADGLAAVERFEHREFARAFLDEPGDPEQVLGPRRTR